ncbi:MAG: hypothetical protein IJ736_02610, partial [Firmicutes bacterium]|nr:hypothetical protein [Bacillota bacterium]
YLTQEKEENEEWIEDEIRYIVLTPYGIQDGENFVVYPPETPLEILPEDFLSWWPGRYDADKKNSKSLDCYGIYSKETGNGFFHYDW